jgi:hypothetical protein
MRGSDMPKVFSAQAAIAALNPHVETRPYNRALTEEIAEELFAEYDLILDGTDSYETRALVNRAAVAVGRPVLAGRDQRMGGADDALRSGLGRALHGLRLSAGARARADGDLCRDRGDRRVARGRRLDDGAGGGEAHHRRGDRCGAGGC